MRVVRSLARLLDKITDLSIVVGGVVITLMMIHIVADIFGRFVLSWPLPGTIGIVSHYYMLVAAFIPLAYAERINAHIAVEVIYDTMPARVRSGAQIITLLLTTAVIALMTAKTWETAVEKYQIGAKSIQGNSVITIWPGYFLVPAGLSLMLIISVANTARLLLQGTPGARANDG